MTKKLFTVHGSTANFILLSLVVSYVLSSPRLISQHATSVVVETPLTSSVFLRIPKNSEVPLGKSFVNKLNDDILISFDENVFTRCLCFGVAPSAAACLAAAVDVTASLSSTVGVVVSVLTLHYLVVKSATSSVKPAFQLVMMSNSKSASVEVLSICLTSTSAMMGSPLEACLPTK